MKAVIDLALLAIIILCAWGGYKKGLIMGVGGIIIILFSFITANIVSNAFYHDVVPALKPFAGGYLEGLVTKEEGVIDSMGWKEKDLSLDDLLREHEDEELEFYGNTFRAFGIADNSAEAMAVEAQEYIKTSGEDVLSALTFILCEKVSYVVCLTLAFLLILIVLTVIGNLPNLSYKIPNLDIVNDISGVLLGILTGVIFCAGLVWVLKFAGILIGSDTLEKTKLAAWFLEKDFVFRYLGI